ncbi:MAG TPA: hypothetical protein VNV37_03270 [Solirubrobacteraceae bacterium]|jgi:hypothetical protein|nr:hypothetical protein [Solirubrobacteraceae bacterium]
MQRINQHAGLAALVVSIVALVLSASGFAGARGGGSPSSAHANSHGAEPRGGRPGHGDRRRVGRSRGVDARGLGLAGHRVSATPLPGGILLPGSDRRFPTTDGSSWIVVVSRDSWIVPSSLPRQPGPAIHGAAADRQGAGRPPRPRTRHVRAHPAAPTAGMPFSFLASACSGIGRRYERGLAA